jgi:uncharacterized protein
MSLFKRRIILSYGDKFRDFFWPRQGIGRTIRYWRYRLVRLPGTPHGIASGVGAGVSMSFMPPGLHMVMAAGLALLTRGNVFAATFISVAFGNPVMTAVLLGADIGLGELLVGGRHRAVGGDISLLEFFQHPLDSFARFGLPFAVGATLLAILSWLGTYVFMKRFVEFAHKQRAKRLKRNWHKRKRVIS